MTAGQPNWQKLHEMGKLPKDARGKISGLAQLDVAEKRIKELENKVAELRGGGDSGSGPENDSAEVKVKCEVEGCGYVASGRTESIAKNNLRLHSRTHDKKEE